MHDTGGWHLAFLLGQGLNLLFIGKRLNSGLAWRTGMDSRYGSLGRIGSSLPLRRGHGSADGLLTLWVSAITFWLKQRVECQFINRARYHVSTTMLILFLVVEFGTTLPASFLL